MGNVKNVLITNVKIAPKMITVKNACSHTSSIWELVYKGAQLITMRP